VRFNGDDSNKIIVDAVQRERTVVQILATCAFVSQRMVTDLDGESIASEMADHLSHS